MSKMLVVVFDDESKAYEGSRALTDLHRDGSISVYGGGQAWELTKEAIAA